MFWLEVADDLVLARLHALHVDLDVAVDHHAELRGAARDIGGAGARHQCLGWNAADIHASAAEELSLDDGDLHAFLGHAGGDRGPDWPVPMTIASNFCAMISPVAGWRRRRGSSTRGDCERPTVSVAAEVIDSITMVAIWNCGSRSVIPWRCATQVKSL